MKKVLVTGGAGFIGSNFVLYLLGEDPQVRIWNLDALTYAGNLENLSALSGEARHTFVRGDVCDGQLVGELFARHGFDTVIHFAAESHVDRSIEDPEVFARTNVMGTLNLLHQARAAWQGPEGFLPGVKFVQVSTDEVYGELGATGSFTEETPLCPRSPYAASKASADCFVQSFFTTYGMPVNITRCSNNYGPYQFPEKMIPLMIHKALKREPLPVYGDGRQVRDWLYVEDHCRAIEQVAREGRPGQVYNVGGENELENLELVRRILAYLQSHVDGEVGESQIRHVADRKGHDRRYAIDAGKIRKELGWRPQVSFDQGIEKTIRWYLENPVWMEQVTSGAYQDYCRQMYGERL